MHYGYAFTKEAGDAFRESSRRINVTRCHRAEVDEFIGDAHVIVPLMCHLDRARLERATKCRLIIQYGAGVEGVDAGAAADLGIMLSNIPSGDTGNAESCAEMAIFLILASLRQINDMAECVQSRRLGVPCGRMLKGSTVCIVGNGNISRALRPRLRAFGVRQFVLGRRVREDLDVDPDVDDYAQVSDPSGVARVLAKTDIVVFACSLTNASRGMMNDDFLRLCKHGVIIINVARGGLLDYGATRSGLEGGAIAGMGLDVQWEEPMDPNDPVFKHPRVYCTPHVAGVTETSYRAMARIVVEQTVKVVLRNEKPTVLLNF